MQPGQCTLPPDATGRILDRLTGLEQIIPPEAVRQVLADTGRTNQRRCLLTHEVVCWVVLAMGILTELPIRQVFKHARRLRFGEETPHRSSLCVARQRLGIAPVRRLFEQLVHPLAEPETPGAFYRGFRLMGLDGTVYDVPDSDPNAAAFSRPSAGSRGDGAFPQIRKLSLVELGTHVELAFVLRSIAHGEQSMVGGLLRHLTAEMLLLEDRGFFSYDHWKEVTSRDVKILAREERVDPQADPKLGRWLVSGQDLSQFLRPPEGSQWGPGPSDPLHAERPATGRSRRRTCSDHQSLG